MDKLKYPLVSVVVPTYNQARYLEACLDSIMFQDYPNLEIIVVADPSKKEKGDMQIMHICVVSLLGYRIDELNIQWRERKRGHANNAHLGL